MIILPPAGSPLVELRKPIRKFGCAAHPDDLLDQVEFNDGFYVKQLQAYKDTTGDDIKLVKCSRPHLIERVK